MKEKNIVITGVNRGLGFYIAQNFLNEGHNLILLSRTNNIKKELIQPIRKKQIIITKKLDLEKKKDIIRIKDIIKKKFKTIDLLINNAAIQGPIGLFHKNDFNLWEKTITINFINTAFLIKNLIPILKKKSLVVNISGGGSTSSRKLFSAYSSSKTALVRLTENLAEEYKKDKIRFVAIAPGALNTRMYKNSSKIEKKMGNYKRVPFADMAKTFYLINLLSKDQTLRFSGKLISAQWDKWMNKKFLFDLKLDKNFLTLRRFIK